MLELAKMFCKVTTFLLLAALSTNGQVYKKVGIVDTEAKRKMFSYHVKILATTKEKNEKGEYISYFGGGSLLNDKWVLTCAHIFSFDEKKITVFAIKNMEYEYNERAGQLQAYHPESWDASTLENDIALVKLKKSFNLDHLSHVSLPQQVNGKYADIAVGTKFQFCGNGKTETKNETHELYYGESYVLKFTRCNNMKNVSKEYQDERKQICAGWKNTNPEDGRSTSGSGDSGAGMVVRSGKKKFTFEIYGVLSYGERGAAPATYDSPDVYTRVSYHMEWITGLTGIDKKVDKHKVSTSTGGGSAAKKKRRQNQNYSGVNFLVFTTFSWLLALKFVLNF